MSISHTRSKPFQYGHPEWKTTCLWLTNLPKLVPTGCVVADTTVGGGKRPGRISSAIHRMGPSKTRQRERSRTYAGIGAAMADQWGRYVMAEEAKLEAECVAELN